VARRPFTDTHVHFHDLREPSLTYAWLWPEDPSDSPDDLGPFGAIKSERYHADDFLAETRFANVDRVVHVQAAIGTDDPVEETRWLQAFADRLGVPHGIVAYADLAAPDVAGLLDRHAAYPNLRGIRDLRYDGYLWDDAWLAGLRALQGRDLVWCDDPLLEHMARAAEVARGVEGLTLCVDHAGYPRRRDDAYFREWREGMRALAAVPTTVVKISGLGMCDHAWTVESLRPWVETCLELWGPERAFFGTNWPVDRLYSSYGDVLDAYAELVAGLPEAQQAALFSGNANRVFRLA
jgi:predicted TIM-barrel fold metal-dependent hydrolase